ncbi:MAG TPA: hypothetical protein VMU20_05835 [Candidatus Dormibacteraeota bacterium]|nr:hypothetical protein [Candidatus Dormibacteraeota bacterium]
MRRLRLVLGALLGAATLALGLGAACGSDSPAGGPGSHDTPEGAVRGFLDAVAANDLKDALNWIPPKQRKAASDLLNGALGVKVSFSVQHIDVGTATIDRENPDQAMVALKGQASACVNGGSGDSALNTCYPFSKFAQTAGSDQISCVRIGGQWYVDFGSGSDAPPSDAGSPAPPTGNGAPTPGG